jgi:UDP-N-acetylglucosamine:LPS N-acetylglucosamine transferase
MVEAGAGVTIQESDLTPESLANELRALLASRDALRARATLARKLARPDALERITELCLQQAEGVA